MKAIHQIVYFADRELIHGISSCSRRVISRSSMTTVHPAGMMRRVSVGIKC
jgi:hypothetical protein